MCGDVATTEIRCKGRDKKSTPKRECQNSANNAKTLRILCEFSARNSKILRLFVHSCFTKIACRECKFVLKTVKDDGSLRVGGIKIEVYTSNVM